MQCFLTGQAYPPMRCCRFYFYHFFSVCKYPPFSSFQIDWIYFTLVSGNKESLGWSRNAGKRWATTQVKHVFMDNGQHQKYLISYTYDTMCIKHHCFDKSITFLRQFCRCRIFMDRPMSALDTAVWYWTNYIKIFILLVQHCFVVSIQRKKTSTVFGI